MIFDLTHENGLFDALGPSLLLAGSKECSGYDFCLYSHTHTHTHTLEFTLIPYYEIYVKTYIHTQAHRERERENIFSETIKKKGKKIIVISLL